MKPYLVLYASKHGQSRLIAERIASELRTQGREASLADLRKVARDPGRCPLLGNYVEVIVVAPLYAGSYPRVVRRFAEEQVSELTKANACFASVSLSQAAVEDEARSPAERSEAQEGLHDCVDRFSEQTGWRPRCVAHFAGALSYTKYGPIIRWVMKRIAKKAGASTDTSRDHELTNWDAVARWVAEVVGSKDERAASPREALAHYRTAALATTH